VDAVLILADPTERRGAVHDTPHQSISWSSVRCEFEAHLRMIDIGHRTFGEAVIPSGDLFGLELLA
jgi:hypothetical protein